MSSSDNKIYNFWYKNKQYHSGTEFIYSGYCQLNGKEVMLKRQRCIYLYCENYQTVYFRSNANIYTDDAFYFSYGIEQIIPVENSVTNEQLYYFTDDMFVNTIWYIVVMLVATIFNDRIAIWIFATTIYYLTTFHKK